VDAPGTSTEIHVGSITATTNPPGTDRLNKEHDPAVKPAARSEWRDRQRTATPR
jgi:hypothetical protein